MLRDRRQKLDAIISAVEQAEEVVATGDDDWDTIIGVIRAMQMSQNTDWAKQYFTDEQRQKMQELSEQSYSEGARAKLAGRTWTAEDQKRIDAQYEALWAGVRRAVAEGKDPSSPEAQELAGQAIGLIEAFTMGDPEIEQGLNTWWANAQALPADQQPYRIPLTDAEAAFLEQAKALYRQRRG